MEALSCLGLHFNQCCWRSYQSWWSFKSRKVPSGFDPPCSAIWKVSELLQLHFQHDNEPKHTANPIKTCLNIKTHSRLSYWSQHYWSSVESSLQRTEQTKEPWRTLNVLEEPWRTIYEDCLKKAWLREFNRHCRVKVFIINIDLSYHSTNSIVDLCSVFPHMFEHVSRNRCTHLPFSLQTIKRWGLVQHSCTILHFLVRDVSYFLIVKCGLRKEFTIFITCTFRVFIIIFIITRRQRIWRKKIQKKKSLINY